MLRQRYVGLLACTALLLLGGCAFHREKNPHNDVLVFATQTKFGVDISAPATSATLPAFTIGYNRSEAVWMPLKPNGTKDHPATDVLASDTVAKLTSCDNALRATVSDAERRNAACLAAVLPAGKYVSMATGIKSDVGGSGLEIDTYSVFASFGARGGISGSQANGGLAQVFATGIAAQRLASNPQVGNALNTAAPSAVAAAEKTKQDEIKALTADDIPADLPANFDTGFNTLRDSIRATASASDRQRKIGALYNSLSPKPAFISSTVQACGNSVNDCLAAVEGDRSTLFGAANFKASVAKWSTY